MDFAPFPESELLPTDSGQATAKGPCLGIAPVSYVVWVRALVGNSAGALGTVWLANYTSRQSVAPFHGSTEDSIPLCVCVRPSALSRDFAFNTGNM